MHCPRIKRLFRHYPFLVLIAHNDILMNICFESFKNRYHSDRLDEILRSILINFSLLN